MKGPNSLPNAISNADPQQHTLMCCLNLRTSAQREAIFCTIATRGFFLLLLKVTVATPPALCGILLQWLPIYDAVFVSARIAFMEGSLDVCTISLAKSTAARFLNSIAINV
jgi:hypothetical protein